MGSLDLWLWVGLVNGMSKRVRRGLGGQSLRPSDSLPARFLWLGCVPPHKAQQLSGILSLQVQPPTSLGPSALWMVTAPQARESSPGLLDHHPPYPVYYTLLTVLPLTHLSVPEVFLFLAVAQRRLSSLFMQDRVLPKDIRSTSVADFTYWHSISCTLCSIHSPFRSSNSQKLATQL